MNQFTDILFYPKPTQWGLRGDPMLWTDLENHFRQSTRVPESITDFRNELLVLYNNLVGQPLKKGVITFVERYESVGMSSGIVSADFWLNTALPLLIERYRIAKLS